MNSYIVSDVIYYCNRSVKYSLAIDEKELDYYDFTFVLSGSLTYFVNGEKIVVENGDAIFLRPGDSRCRAEGKAPAHYISFNFLSDNEKMLPFGRVMKKCISGDIRRLISVYPPQHLVERFHAKEKCQNILNYILLELYDRHKMRSTNEHVIKIIKYVDEHITERMSLWDIAEKFHLSKEHTSYIFKREMGTPLVSYINEQKSLLAKKLILSDEMVLSDISDYLGFENYDYFSKTFKKYMGVTPLKLKKNKSAQ